ncbi:MAG: hypothetical protein R2739_00180 [Chitinophagales bacterium]|nr:hypothetical protein [Bacteroidota bacterium]
MFKKSDFHYKNIQPLQQGIVVCTLLILIALTCFIVGKKDIIAWNFLAGPIMLYCVFNPLMGAFRENRLPYFGKSVLVFLGILTLVYVLGNAISVVSYHSNSELHIITIILFIFYFMFNFLCTVFRAALRFFEEIDN